VILETVNVLRPLGDIPKWVLIITDGEDVTGDDQLTVCHSVLDSHIVIDFFLLATTKDEDVDKALLPLAHYSGGCCFHPTTIDDSIAILRKEEFIDLHLRDLSRSRSTITASDLAVAAKYLKFSEKVPFRLKYKQSDELRTYQRIFSDTPPPHSCVTARIFDEMRICIDAGFTALALSLAEWRVFIRQSSVLWDLLVTFPPGYPHAPPVLRFLSIPPLANVSAAGRVTNSATAAYHPRTHIATLLRSVEALFAHEDPKARPLDQETGVNVVRWEIGEWERMIKARTSTPWLPVPAVEYLGLYGGPIKAGGAAGPKRAKAANLGDKVWSRGTWKRIVGAPVEVNGNLLDSSEVKIFSIKHR
jgi:hypothetical protein